MNDILIHIEKELSKRHRCRTEIMKSAIDERLNKSLETYAKGLDSGVNYINGKSELNVLRKL
jgi:hypothetical protein